MIFTKKELKRHVIYVACILIFPTCSKKLKPLEAGTPAFENTLILISVDGFRWD